MAYKYTVLDLNVEPRIVRSPRRAKAAKNAMSGLGHERKVEAAGTEAKDSREWFTGATAMI
jgi:hypothetical protein